MELLFQAKTSQELVNKGATLDITEQVLNIQKKTLPSRIINMLPVSIYLLSS